MFFLNPVTAEEANIRNRGIKLRLKQAAGLLFNIDFLTILQSVHMGVISTNMCGSMFIHVFYAYLEFSPCFRMCVMACVTELTKITNRTHSRLARQNACQGANKTIGFS